MLIRPWTESDIELVREIAWKTWLAAYSSFVPEKDLRAFHDAFYTADGLLKIVRAPRSHGWIAGERLGFAKARFGDDGKYNISSIYVLPEHQGKGAGHALLAAAEKTGRELYGAKEVWLGVMTANQPALAWYRKLGFQFTREEPFRMGETEVPHLIGFRALAS